jgi:hypothetical protein
MDFGKFPWFIIQNEELCSEGCSETLDNLRRILTGEFNGEFVSGRVLGDG